MLSFWVQTNGILNFIWKVISDQLFCWIKIEWGIKWLNFRSISFQKGNYIWDSPSYKILEIKYLNKNTGWRYSFIIFRRSQENFIHTLVWSIFFIQLKRMTDQNNFMNPNNNIPVEFYWFPQQKKLMFMIVIIEEDGRSLLYFYEI